jgi:hypothetical protein
MFNSISLRYRSLLRVKQLQASLKPSPKRAWQSVARPSKPFPRSLDFPPKLFAQTQLRPLDPGLSNFSELCFPPATKTLHDTPPGHLTNIYLWSSLRSGPIPLGALLDNLTSLCSRNRHGYTTLSLPSARTKRAVARARAPIGAVSPYCRRTAQTANLDRPDCSSMQRGSGTTIGHTELSSRHLNLPVAPPPSAATQSSRVYTDPPQTILLHTNLVSHNQVQ